MSFSAQFDKFFCFSKNYAPFILNSKIASNVYKKVAAEDIRPIQGISQPSTSCSVIHLVQNKYVHSFQTQPGQQNIVGGHEENNLR